jgi:hypothetical protein
MRSGKSHSSLPSSVLRICPRTLSSPLILILTGAHQYVMVVLTTPKCCFVMAIHA